MSKFITKLKLYLIDIPRGNMLLGHSLKFFTGLLIGAYYVDKFLLDHIVVAYFAAFFSIYFVYSFNALIDLKKDYFHSEKQNRPLPSGKAKKEYATFLIFLSLFLAVILSLFINLEFLFSIILVILLGTMYNLSKRRHYLFQTLIFFVASGVLSYLCGYLVLSTTLYIPLLIYLLLHGIYFSTHIHLKDILDIKSDKKVGVKSFPITFSIKKLISFLKFIEIVYTGILLCSIFVFKEFYLIALLPNIIIFFFIQKNLSMKKYDKAYLNFLKLTPTTFFFTLLGFILLNF